MRSITTKHANHSPRSTRSQRLPSNETPITGSQIQPRSEDDREAAAKTRDGKRNTLLHRFYEPLVLLYVLDRTQGDHILRPGPEKLPSGDLPVEELRRRFFDELSYVCDYDKGGDTATAIAAASTPLTYYIASNKDSRLTVEPFLRRLLLQLGGLYDLDSQRLREAEDSILQDCVDFSEKRVNTYLKNLHLSLTDCLTASPEDPVVRGEIVFPSSLSLCLLQVR